MFYTYMYCMPPVVIFLLIATASCGETEKNRRQREREREREFRLQSKSVVTILIYPLFFWDALCGYSTYLKHTSFIDSEN